MLLLSSSIQNYAFNYYYCVPLSWGNAVYVVGKIPLSSLRRDLHGGKWVKMFFIVCFFFYKNFVLIFICLPLGDGTDAL